MTFSPKKFILVTVGIAFGFVFAFIALNYYSNDFGLWRSRPAVRIWTDEKTSKYLLSFRYIPENFDGVLIGPSLSANIDTRAIATHKIYNLSMNGANISELRYASDNALRGGTIRTLVICLDPYITKTSGRRGAQIDEREYWGSLFSTLPIRIWRAKYDCWRFPQRDPFHDSEWGYHDFSWSKRNVRLADFIKKRKTPQKIYIDPLAYEDLQAIVDAAHSKRVQIFAFFYPRFFQLRPPDAVRQKYYQKIEQLFDKRDIIWDFNTTEYQHITQDPTCYTDGHLSKIGATRTVTEIAKKLRRFARQQK